MSDNCLGVIISGQLFYGAIASCQGLISGEAIFWGSIILGGGGAIVQGLIVHGAIIRGTIAQGQLSCSLRYKLLF